MTYFKKVGRLTDEEQAVVNSIEQHINNKEIPLSEIPECNTLDDLLEIQLLVEAYEKKEDGIISDVEPEITLEQETTEQHPIEDLELSNTDGIEQIEPLDPLEKESESTEIVVDENDSDSLDFVSNDYDPFAEEIIERSYNVEGKETDPDNPKVNALSEDEELELPESSTTPVDNLNPNTKKKAAEQTADVILKGYSRIAPLPFKWLAKVNERKIKKLEFEGHIDITIEVSEGMTFDDYMKQTNEQVDEIFTVEGDTLEEIREPLIEVLMEQEMELTPQQRLLMAVVSHLFQMLTAALSLRKQNNDILENQISIMRGMRHAS